MIVRIVINNKGGTMFQLLTCRRVEHYSIPYVHNTFNKYCELYLFS